MFNNIYQLIFLLLISSFSLAQEKTFIREYTHKVGDADSKITSRALALNQVKKILLEETGVYIESTFEMETTEINQEIKELTKNQIVSITAGITKTKIIDEKWDGIEYYIKAEITLDIGDVKNMVRRIAEDRDKTKQLVDAKNRAEKAFLALSVIKEKLKRTNSENGNLRLQLEYAKKTNILSATDWFQRGVNAHEHEEFDKAIEYFQNSVELDSNASDSYFRLSVIYGGIDFPRKNYYASINYLKKAIKIDSLNSFFYFNLGCAYNSIKEDDEAIKYYLKAITINPNNSWAYTNLGATYWENKKYQEAIESYLKVIEIGKDNDIFSYYRIIGDICFEMEEVKTAIMYYQKAARLGSKNAKVFLNKHNISW